MIGDDTFWMQMALREAEKALEKGEVPVGAVIVLENRVIGKGHNSVESLQDPTAHAEMLAITAAANTLESWRLIGARMYVTLEPCHMCSGASVLSRLEQVFYGADDPKAGACGSLSHVCEDSRLNHQVQVVRGLLADESAIMLKEFFRRLRQKRN